MGGYAGLILQQGVRNVSGKMNDIEKMKQLKHPLSFWNSVVAGGLGAIDPSLSSQYLDTKLDRQNEWEQREQGREAIAGINEAANLQTEAARSAINKQLGLNQQGLASTMAVSGGIRTGNYQRKVGELNTQAVEDVARVAGQNALQAKMLELGYTQNVQNFNLELAKLESAKSAGDAQMAGVAAENLAPIIYDMFFKGKGQGELPVSNAEEIVGGVSDSNYNLNEQIVGGEYPKYNESPTLEYVRSLYNPKPKTAGAGGFAPTIDDDDPLSILWGD